MAGAIAALPSDLQEPYEFLDLEHLGSITLNLTSYQLGTGLIHPTAITPRQVRLHMMQNGLSAPPVAGTPITVRIPVMRVFGQRVDQPSPFTTGISARSGFRRTCCRGSRLTPVESLASRSPRPATNPRKFSQSNKAGKTHENVASQSRTSAPRAWFT
jgi:hypothetical protein